MRVAISIASAVLAATYAQVGAAESLSSGSVAVVLAGQTASSTGILISQPLDKPLAKNVIQRGGIYYVSGAVICRMLTAPPRMRFKGIDIAASTCLKIGSASFKVRSDAPISRGILSVVHSGGESAIGTFDVVAATSAPAPTPPPPTTSLLSVSPVQLSFTADPYQSLHVPPTRQIFEVRHTGGGTLTWTISENLRWLRVVANEQCAVPSSCPDCGILCSGGIKGTPDNNGAVTFSGSGTAIVGVRAPGYTLPSGYTTTGTISISTNVGNASVSVTVTTPANMEFDCSNGANDDADDTGADSSDPDCGPNPWAGF